MEISSALAQRSNKIGKKRRKKRAKRVFPFLLEIVGGAFPTVPQRHAMQEFGEQAGINEEEGQEEEGEQSEEEGMNRRALVDARKLNKHAHGTKSSYFGKQKNFVEFVAESYPHVLASPFRVALDEEDEEGDTLKSRGWFEDRFGNVSKEDKDTHITKDGTINGKIVEEWLAGFTGRGGVAPSDKCA